MNLKRKPPTVRQNQAKKRRSCDEKTAANALLLLLNSKNDVGKTDDEITSAETLLSFGVDVTSRKREILTEGFDHSILPVCINEKESLTDEMFTNVDQEIHDEHNEKNETSTMCSTQVIIKHIVF